MLPAPEIVVGRPGLVKKRRETLEAVTGQQRASPPVTLPRLHGAVC